MKNKAIHITFFLLLLPFVLFSQFSIVPSVVNASCSDSHDGSISVLVSGGTAPYAYLWSPGGETTSSITGLNAGTYAVTVTDNAGADSTVSYVLGPSTIVNDTLGKIKYPYCTNNGYIVLHVSGGSGTYQYAWNTGSSGIGITDLGAGDYSVIVTDAGSCTSSFAFSLTETECFVTPQTYFTPNDDGINDTWIIINSEYFEDAKLIVFDRWGTKVYEHKGKYENWDGKSYLGIPVPDAVYYYFFYQDKDDKQKASKHGSVTILR
jgi:gliding motility-associated-like protein